jgi:hypothetical protein
VTSALAAISSNRLIARRVFISILLPMDECGKIDVQQSAVLQCNTGIVLVDTPKFQRVLVTASNLLFE